MLTCEQIHRGIERVVAGKVFIMAWCRRVGKSYEGTTRMCMCKVDFSLSDFGELEMLIDKRC